MAQRASQRTGTSDQNLRVISLDAVPTGPPSVRRQHHLLYRWMAVTDSICIVAALLLAHQLQFGLATPTADFLLMLLLAPFVTVACHLGCRLYHTYRYTSVEEFRRIIL